MSRPGPAGIEPAFGPRLTTKSAVPGASRSTPRSAGSPDDELDWFSSRMISSRNTEVVSTGASNPLSLSLTTSPVVFTIGRTAGHGCQGARLPRRKFRHRSGAPTTMTSTADHTGVPVI